MCELQVLDDEAEQYQSLDARQYHGSIYGMVPAKRGALKPAGEWNHQRVSVIGHSIRVELNGVEIVNADVEHIHDFKDGTPHPGKNRLSGYFGFAGHNDPVQFKNIWLRRSIPTVYLTSRSMHDSIATSVHGDPAAKVANGR